MDKQITTRIGIIGSAGRKDDAALFTKEVYKDAFGSLCCFIADMNRLNPANKFTLVSGGAAGVDHMAIHFFLMQYIPCSLKLFLPCKFEDTAYEDTLIKNNAGGVANYYHKKFSERLGIDSLNEIKLAIEAGADVETGGGMFGRNTKIAENVDVIFAATFGHLERIKEGGTLDTCNKFLKKNAAELVYHCDLHDPTKIHWPAQTEPKIYI